MKTKNILLTTLLIILPWVVSSQSVAEDIRVKDALNLIEKWIESQSAYDQIPGISMAIVHDQNIIWRYATGYADPDKKTPTTTKTIYSICSISKLFTSIALMQLRDQGLLRLDDPVSKHLPWFNIKQVYPNSQPITIESMLTHSSGLPRESDYPYWNAPKFDFPVREKMIALYADLDTAIGKIADNLNSDDTMVFVSDHGFGPLKRIFHLNTWLKQNGYLSKQLSIYFVDC